MRHLLEDMPMGYSFLVIKKISIMETLDGLEVSSPLFLVSALQRCNICGKENRVAAIATRNIVIEDEEDDGFLLSYIEWLPPEILSEILKAHPQYSVNYSHSMGSDYFMTVCECEGHYGDHYVQKQILDEAFRSPENLEVFRLPVSGTWVIPCGYASSLSVGELLDRHS